jgi:ankyrin repeat protein
MLSQAAENGLTNLFRCLIEGGQDLKTVDSSGVWLLHSAAAGGSAEIVGLLLDKEVKYLFFLSQRDGASHAYWVTADVIEKARPKR